MSLLLRILRATRRPGCPSCTVRHRKPTLEALEGRTLLSVAVAAISPMPPPAGADPTAAQVGQPMVMVSSRLRIAVAD